MDRMTWLNEPGTWNETAEGLVLGTEPKTDFWRITHDGGRRDNGHFYYDSRRGDFTALVHVEGDFGALYDQAGLMLRIDEGNWIKCGIELFDDQHWRSVVVTREFSDWSVTSQGRRNDLWIRLRRSGNTVEAAMSEDGDQYLLFRQAYFPESDPVLVGCMAASPTGPGFEARFSSFSVS